jgi:plastocyanin
MQSLRRTLVRVVLLAGGVTLLGSCTSSTPHTGSSTAVTVNGIQNITVSGGDNDRFSPSTITVTTGEQVRITLKNTGKGAPHNWTLPDFGADFVPDTAAGTSTSKLFIAPIPGSYQFVCTIHQKEGMVGKLVVVPK